MKTPYTDIVLLGSQIKAMFPNVPKGKKTAPDRTYVVPKKRHLLKDVADVYWKELKHHGCYDWYKFHDCDNKAMVWKVVADLLFGNHQVRLKEKKRILAEGVACGIVFYMRDNGGGHAINFAVIAEKGELKVIFIEPQTQYEVELSDKEQKSIMFMYV